VALQGVARPETHLLDRIDEHIGGTSGRPTRDGRSPRVATQAEFEPIRRAFEQLLADLAALHAAPPNSDAAA
jgi:hypothetical protein